MSKIVLLGDSITEYLPYVYKGKIGTDQDEVVNYGIENIGAGVYLKHVWPQVDHDNVDTYILLIGINNILRPDCDYDNEDSLCEIIDKIKKLVLTIKNNHKKEFIVQSIYPTAYKNVNEKVIEVNSSLQSFCEDLNITYLDMYGLLVDKNGLFDEKYRKDNIHPNSRGYELIVNEINGKLKTDNVVKYK